MFQYKRILCAQHVSWLFARWAQSSFCPFLQKTSQISAKETLFPAFFFFLPGFGVRAPHARGLRFGTHNGAREQVIGLILAPISLLPSPPARPPPSAPCVWPLPAPASQMDRLSVAMAEPKCKTSKPVCRTKCSPADCATTWPSRARRQSAPRQALLSAVLCEAPRIACRSLPSAIHMAYNHEDDDHVVDVAALLEDFKKSRVHNAKEIVANTKWNEAPLLSSMPSAQRVLRHAARG